MLHTNLACYFQKRRNETKFTAVPEQSAESNYGSGIMRRGYIEVKTETGCDFSLATGQELSDRSNIFKPPGYLGVFNSFPERPAFSKI